jgi:hypothetical protein
VSGPLPPTDLDRRTPRWLDLPAGTIVFRFYEAEYDPIYFDPSLFGRLNAPDGAYGVLYTAREESGAFAETFLRTPGRRMVDPGLLARKAYVRLQLTRDLRLVDFDGPGLPILGATAAVVHSDPPYGVPQAWSAALRAHPGGPDGIAYTSRHDPSQLCYALFDTPPYCVVELERRIDLDASWFWELAEGYHLASAPT